VFSAGRGKGKRSSNNSQQQQQLQLPQPTAAAAAAELAVLSPKRELILGNDDDFLSSSSVQPGLIN
jgi:hypothetical protein